MIFANKPFIVQILDFKVVGEWLGMPAFGDYQLVPCASHSFIRVTRTPGDKLEELPMYGAGGWRPFGQTGLDQALVAFLDCLSQVERQLRTYYPSVGA
jgi:hypothetical protein